MTPPSTASSHGCRSATRRPRPCSPAAGRASSPRSRASSSDPPHSTAATSTTTAMTTTARTPTAGALDAVLENRAAPVVAFEIHGKIMCRFDEWFDDVLSDLCDTGLQELGIWNNKFNDCYEVPSPVYRCKTLTSLELFCCRLRVPGTITGLRAVRSLVLRNVVASYADLRRIISRCSAVQHLEIDDIHKARSIVIHAPSLEKLEISSYRPLCISVKKAPRLDTVGLSLCYACPEDSWSVHDTQNSDGDYSFSEIEEMFDFKKMAKKEHKKTDEIKNDHVSQWNQLHQEAPLVLVD
ncbi:hypothetical protein PR202_ga15542 [Eleusine coracana subsp. coracana]|uniref:F-box/LRR-repeat protein 15/At3g58940/PEG3-like LRR domain-containing protein n=1 Tax=Eleusine coracana subsp. coracana TaxID=191504 RepID=A0AAV5CK42_ELECO|nr:hypothetical protein PR202_ga15542 [Eleusine coracana subsp. coracana]